MKVCIVADVHLFSSMIGGNWPKESFKIFTEKILPRIKQENPGMTVFLGDTLDPGSGKGVQWTRGDEINRRFVDTLKSSNIGDMYILQGNHDFKDPLTNISRMGGLRFIEDDWITVEGVDFYFFSSRYNYRDIERTKADLKKIPHKESSNVKILLMHDAISIPNAVNIPDDIMKGIISKRFDMIFNGHQHSEHKYHDNIWCLSSALPWKIGSRGCEIFDGNVDKLEIKKEDRFGFYIVDTDNIKLRPKFIRIELGVDIVKLKLQIKDETAISVREKLISMSKRLQDITNPDRTIVRIYLEGNLKKGDDRYDIGTTQIINKYYSKFYEGKKNSVINVDDLRGGGAHFNKDNFRNLSVEAVLESLESEVPIIQEFYKEIRDLIEPKTFVAKSMIDKIEDSKILG